MHRQQSTSHHWLYHKLGFDSWVLQQDCRILHDKLTIDQVKYLSTHIEAIRQPKVSPSIVDANLIFAFALLPLHQTHKLSVAAKVYTLWRQQFRWLDLSNWRLFTKWPDRSADLHLLPSDDLSTVRCPNSPRQQVLCNRASPPIELHFYYCVGDGSQVNHAFLQIDAHDEAVVWGPL